jgi:NAD(P)-dependent dehydrogenase (short-subunit alcohol dehydrogenase family)
MAVSDYRRDMTSPRIALVTGATQGLGLALAQGLAARLGPADRVLLTGRDAGRVSSAVATVGRQRATVEGRLLDVRDAGAIAALAEDVRQSHGGIDIVFSNAGARMSPDADPADEVDAVVETYNLGATRMLRSFLPVLRPRGRMLVVASSLGTLHHLGPRVRPRLADPESLDEVDAVVEDWRAAVHAGRAHADGWPDWLNLPSKVAQVAAVRAVAAERRDRDLAAGTLVAAVCPGLIDTGASRPWFEDMSQAQTPAEAAVALLDLALEPEFDPAFYGELVRFGAVVPWREEVAVATPRSP